jgi:hypothetical protein
MSTTAEIFASALTLSEKERAALALRLLESIGEDFDRAEEDDVDDDLAVEVARRLDELRGGKVAAIDGRAAIAAIRSEFSR